MTDSIPGVYLLAQARGIHAKSHLRIGQPFIPMAVRVY